MVMHELATNAAKYGALSRPEGLVSVHWLLPSKRTSGPAVQIQCHEVGGPEVANLARQGYGSSVNRDLLSYELGGKVDLASARQGVRCRIELPAWWILAALT